MTDQQADKVIQQAVPPKTDISLVLWQENGEVWLKASAGCREGNRPVHSYSLRAVRLNP